jgi:methionine biosynthesis protein MetW
MSPKLEFASKSYYEECWATGGVYAEVSHVPLDPAIHRFLETLMPHQACCLDVGCGEGNAAPTLLRGRISHYVGVDISENAVRKAREHGLDARTIEDASSLPFSDATFDLVLCAEVLEHVFQPQLVASEILRVLRPGALAIVTVPNVTHWRHRISFCFAGCWDPYGYDLSVEQPWCDPHIRFFTNKTLQRMLTLAGFDRVRVNGGLPERLRHVPWVALNFDRLSRSLRFPSWVSRRLIALARKPGGRW